jgi:ketosteroid isomerase-like protein
MPIPSQDLEKWTDEFFDAVARRDLDDAVGRIHPDARAMQNFVGRETDARSLLRSLGGLLDSVQGFAYENPRRVVGADAVVEQHDVRITREDGREVVIDVCIILRFDEQGRIVRLDEYLDSAAAAALR